MSGRVGNMVHLLWFRRKGLMRLIFLSVRTLARSRQRQQLSASEKKDGFVDFPQGFEIYQVELDRDRWVEGFKYTE